MSTVVIETLTPLDRTSRIKIRVRVRVRVRVRYIVLLEESRYELSLFRSFFSRFATMKFL